MYDTSYGMPLMPNCMLCMTFSAIHQAQVTICKGYSSHGMPNQATVELFLL